MMDPQSYVVEIFFEHCRWRWREVWYITDSIILVAGLLTNLVMLWVLLREKNAFTASQVGAAQGGRLGVLLRFNGGKCHTSDYKFT